MTSALSLTINELVDSRKNTATRGRSIGLLKSAWAFHNPRLSRKDMNVKQCNAMLPSYRVDGIKKSAYASPLLEISKPYSA